MAASSSATIANSATVATNDLLNGAVPADSIVDVVAEVLLGVVIGEADEEEGDDGDDRDDRRDCNNDGDMPSVLLSQCLQLLLVIAVVVLFFLRFEVTETRQCKSMIDEYND